MIKIEDYKEIKVLAGGGVKSFMYQIPNVRFHMTLSNKVSDYKIGCAEILRLFIGRNLYHAHSVHMNKQREDKVNYGEPPLGNFLRTYKIRSEDIDNLLKCITEYDAEDYGCGQITNVFLEIPNPEIGKKFNVGFNNKSNITTIFSTPINKEASQANNSS